MLAKALASIRFLAIGNTRTTLFCDPIARFSEEAWMCRAGPYQRHNIHIPDVDPDLKVVVATSTASLLVHEFVLGFPSSPLQTAMVRTDKQDHDDVYHVRQDEGQFIASAWRGRRLAPCGCRHHPFSIGPDEPDHRMQTLGVSRHGMDYAENFVQTFEFRTSPIGQARSAKIPISRFPSTWTTMCLSPIAFRPTCPGSATWHSPHKFEFCRSRSILEKGVFPQPSKPPE